MGSAIASTGVLLLTACLFILYLKKVTSVQLAQFGYYIKLAVASVCMTASVIGFDIVLQRAGDLFGSSRLEAAVIGSILIAIGAFVFLTVVAKSKILSEKEWFLVPFGRKMAAYQLMLNKKRGE